MAENGERSETLTPYEARLCLEWMPDFEHPLPHERALRDKLTRLLEGRDAQPHS